MDRYLQLTDADRKIVCEQAGASLNLPPFAIEKDFWVCWTLREMFSLPECKAALAFKGGTSLSKGYNLIQRFSEDIDVVIDRHGLGLSAADELSATDGNNDRKRKLRILKEASRHFTRSVLEKGLQDRCGAALREGTWDVAYNETNDDSWELQFQYPSVFDTAGNLLPYVKIEPGSRSDIEPLESPGITPFIAEGMKDAAPILPFQVATVSPRRTFWEKVMLLHEKAIPDQEQPPAARLSRHYYDIWCLWQSGIGEAALNDDALFQRVKDHRILYFQPRKAARETLNKGTLVLVPPDEMMGDWRRDYAAMTEMFFAEPPAFEELIETARAIQDAFNSH